VRHVALKIPLGAFAVVGRRQGSDTTNARVQALCDAFDHAAFACCITAFKKYDHLLFGRHHPVLQLHQLALQAQQLAEVGDTVGVVALFIDGHLQLFIERVQEVIAQALNLCFVEFVLVRHSNFLCVNCLQ